MSLKSFLEENADVRDYLRASFRKPEVPRHPMVLPPRTKNTSLVGTAFDYLMRWKIGTINPDAVERDHLVAEGASARLTDESLQQQAGNLVSKALRVAKRFRKNGALSDDVIAAAVSLARLDVVFRTGGRYAELMEEPAAPDDISDLRALVDAIPGDTFMAKTDCYLNPTFGEASQAIDGADADVVIDDLMLEIKVTKEVFKPEHFQQLLGYCLLYSNGGIDGIYHIERMGRIGLYSARYAVFLTWPIADLAVVPFEDSVAWFRERLGMPPFLDD